MQIELLEEDGIYSIIKIEEHLIVVRENFKIMGNFKTLKEAQNYITQLKKNKK